MVSYISSENKLRKQYCEEALSKAAEILGDPMMAQVLGPDLLARLRVAHELAIIPNERHGRLYMPRGVSEDAYPVWAAKYGEPFTYKTELTPFQREAAHEQATVLNVEDAAEFKDDLDSSTDMSMLRTGRLLKDSDGIAKMPHFEWGEIKVFTRPLVLLNFAGRYTPAGAAPVVTHEISHVADAYLEPVFSDYGPWRAMSELKAYAVEAIGAKRDDMITHTIEAARRHHNGPIPDNPDAFRVGPALVRELRWRGLGHAIGDDSGDDEDELEATQDSDKDYMEFRLRAAREQESKE